MRIFENKRLSTAVFGIAVLVACGSAPPESTDAGEEEQVAGTLIDVDYDEDRLICKRQRVVGSHVPQTICKTESQIRAEREALESRVGPRRPVTGYSQYPDPGAEPR
jgi:hypothetical protein